MEITSELGRDCLLHFKEKELIALNYKGKMFKVEEMNQGDREEFYSVDKIKVWTLNLSVATQS